MIRPTLGREASSATPGRPDPFPHVLATALDRTAHGAPASPSAVLAAVPDPLPPDVSPAVGAVVARRIAARSRSGVGFVPVALVPDVDDTPGPQTDHLIETVEPAAVGWWRDYLRARDTAARRRLVEHYGALVRGVGAKLAVRLPSSIELSDLLQSGTFGLMEAIDRFDPRRGVRFEGYAARRVHGAMLDELRAQDWVPRTVRARFREVERAREAVQSRSGRPASDRELAAELGIGLRELRQAVRPVHLLSAEGLGGFAAPDGGGLAALVADDSGDPLLLAARRETRDELCAAIAYLGDRDRTVLRLYYLEEMTLAEIGSVLGVTESRVCQLHARVLARLRIRMEPALAG